MGEYINMKKFNDWLADKLSIYLATMTMFWIIFFLAILPLLIDIPKTPKEWAQYLLSAFFQGVALPVLGYSALKSEKASKKSGEEQAKLLKETHDAIMSEFKSIKHLLKETDHIEQELDTILHYAST
jgi:hypothetical protein